MELKNANPIYLGFFYSSVVFKWKDFKQSKGKKCNELKESD